MEVRRIGKRGIIFTFYELKTPTYDCFTNIFTIIGSKYFFICDTYLGPYYIRDVKKYLEENFGHKEYIVFNSHYHWDHIWGNSYFKESLILSHELCRKAIIDYGGQDIEENEKEFAKDKIEIVLPNVTFKDKLTFEDEGIEFFYSPGHSEDCASCMDYIDNTLFVGDNVDNPIPSYMTYNNLKEYIKTMEGYLSRGAEYIVMSHGLPSDNNLVRQNIDYILRLMKEKTIDFSDEEYQKRHMTNIKYLK